MHLQDLDEPIFRRACLHLEKLHDLVGHLRRGAPLKQRRHRSLRPHSAPRSSGRHSRGWTISAGLLSSVFRFEERRDTASVIGDATAGLTLTPPGRSTYSGFDAMTSAFCDLLTLASGEACGLISMSLVIRDPRRVALGPW